MPFKSKEEYRNWAQKRRNKNRLALRELKERTPCKDCGGRFPHYVTEFDHVPERGDKKFCVGALVGPKCMTNPRILEEMAKCDLVCANCHAIRTYERRNTAK